MRINSTFSIALERTSLFTLAEAWLFVCRVRNKLGKNLRYKPGSSGPFGEESEGPWLPIEDVAYEFLHHSKSYGKRGTMDLGSIFTPS